MNSAGATAVLARSLLGVNDPIPEPSLRDADGAPETVYITVGSQAPEDGWFATSLDVGSWRPLTLGDRLVALDRASTAEFVVEVAEVDQSSDEVFYRLPYLAELDPAAEPALNSTRPWLRRGELVREAHSTNGSNF